MLLTFHKFPLLPYKKRRQMKTSFEPHMNTTAPCPGMTVIHQDIISTGLKAFSAGRKATLPTINWRWPYNFNRAKGRFHFSRERKDAFRFEIVPNRPEIIFPRKIWFFSGRNDFCAGRYDFCIGINGFCAGRNDFDVFVCHFRPVFYDFRPALNHFRAVRNDF